VKTRRLLAVPALLLGLATGCSGGAGDPEDAAPSPTTTTSTIALGESMTFAELRLRPPAGWAAQELIPEELWVVSTPGRETVETRITVSRSTDADTLGDARALLDADFRVTGVDEPRTIALGGPDGIALRFTQRGTTTTYTESVLGVAPSGMGFQITLHASDEDTLNGLLAVIRTVEFVT
jgi:hypothetical protein